MRYVSNSDFLACINKRRYASEDEAKAMKKIREDKTENLVLRVYLCPNCEGFHLTSKPEKKYVSSLVDS